MQSYTRPARLILRSSICAPARGASLARARCALPVQQRLGQVEQRRWTSQGLRDKSAIGPFTWKAASLFVVTGAALYIYFESEKSKMQERQESQTSSVGKPNIGGPFVLTRAPSLSTTNTTINSSSGTSEPTQFTDADLLGKFSLIYFGFTNCPDICPEELDKMSEVVEETDKLIGKPVIQPIFISCDPARDTIPQVSAYIRDFHPRMIGLTGTYEQVKKACRSYRVYFSTPPDAKAEDDYLVDHSIFFYLMDPHGQFVDAFGKNSTAEDVTAKVMQAVERWRVAGETL
ncbi:hypothetical protein QFC21_007058 [Naganishia friedmannii]|uniref:Uncharacterized protein n=1 Tax=Naganishia friedmannii TaxID=89922 RepID=A0ACC2UYW5_9TREE|nr:hypothetical protein QFC21_007058 [Naganishia friedmannii]